MFRVFLCALAIICLMANCGSGDEPAGVVRPDPNGDPLPPGALLRLGSTRWRATGRVYMIAYLPGGKSLLTVDQNHMAQVWDAATDTELRRIDMAGGAGPLPHASFGLLTNGSPLSRDGRVLACLGRDGKPHTWDVTTGKEIRRFDIALESGLTWASLAVSPDGNNLAAMFRWDRGIHVFDENGKLQHVLRDPNVHRGMYPRIGFSRDGKTLFQISEAGVGCWDVIAGKLVRQFDIFAGSGSFSHVMRTTVSPDSTVIAVPQRREIVLFDLSTGKELRRWKDDTIMSGPSLGFSPDGKKVVTIGGISDSLTVWDAATGKQMRRFNQPSMPNQYPFGYENATSSVAIAPDGKTVAAPDGAAILLYDLDTGKKRNPSAAHSVSLYNAFFTPDGKSVVTLAADGASSRWDAPTGQHLENLALSGQVGQKMTLPSPDGKSIAVSSWIGTDVGIYDSTTRMGHIFLSTEEPGKPPIGVRFAGGAFSPNGKTFAVISTRGTIARLFDSADGKMKFEMRLPESDSRNANLPPGGDYRAWSPPIFSGDGPTFATVDNSRLALFDARRGDVGRVIELGEGKIVRSAALSRDGRIVAVDFANGEIGLCACLSGAAEPARRIGWRKPDLLVVVGRVDGGLEGPAMVARRQLYVG